MGPRIRSTGITAPGSSVGAGLLNCLVYGSGWPLSVRAALRPAEQQHGRLACGAGGGLPELADEPGLLERDGSLRHPGLQRGACDGDRRRVSAARRRSKGEWLIALAPEVEHRARSRR